MKITYAIEDYDEDYTDGLSIETNHTPDTLFNLSLIAEACAMDYFNRHSGWESYWPLTISYLY
jgi:hypothetical protein